MVGKGSPFTSHSLASVARPGDMAPYTSCCFSTYIQYCGGQCPNNKTFLS